MAKVRKTTKTGAGRTKKARPSATANKGKASAAKAKVRLPAVRVRSRAYVGLPPGICRVEQESTRTFGYVVRVGHRRSAKGWRPKYTAYFGDFSHGGKKPALAAATRWLKTLERTGKAPEKK
ncbi:MAG: hypothetical protein ABI587_15945 [Gemmatimonadales bacterium]